MLKFADGPFCKLIKNSQGVFQKSDIFPVATVMPMSPMPPRCRGPLAVPPGGQGPPPRCGLSLPSSTCWPPCSLFPAPSSLAPASCCRRHCRAAVDAGRPEASRRRPELPLAVLRLCTDGIDKGGRHSPAPAVSPPPPAEPPRTITSPADLPLLLRPWHELPGEPTHLPGPLAFPLSLSVLLSPCTAVLLRCHGRRRVSGDHLVQPPPPFCSSPSPLATIAVARVQFRFKSTNL